VLGGELPKAPVGLPIILDEHVIPNFDDIGTIGIDKRRGVAVADPIVMDFLNEIKFREKVVLMYEEFFERKG
jgi:hypothetical protein